MKMTHGVMYTGEQESYASPMTWLKDAQLICKEARSNITRPPRVEWVQHGQLKLVSHGTVTSTAALSTLMHAAIDEASQALQILVIQTPTNSRTEASVYDAPVPSLA
ncbi:hypothetical protein CIB48_g3690 [Xylaria polymorpha]|nr:hypothetical protein CIB48_g3690 [Xylaria polymorpha]